MKCAIFENYGGPEVITVTECPRPNPKENEVLVKVAYSSVTSGDANIRGSVFVPDGFKFLVRVMFGFKKPRSPLLGMEFSGEIVEIGSAVKKFKAGDKVFGHLGKNRGAYAEYIAINEDAAITHQPSNLNLKQSAVLGFGGLTALYFVHKLGQVSPNQSVLVYGASGCVGSYAVQIAKHYGASVTAVCSNGNRELVMSLGADQVIDYTKEDFTKNGQIYDVIIETKGKNSFKKICHSLKPHGRFLAVAGGPKEMFQMLLSSLGVIGGGKKILGGDGGEKQTDLVTLKHLAEQGAITPVIDRTFSLDDIVEAHRYVDGGHKRGNVVIKI